MKIITFLFMLMLLPVMASAEDVVSIDGIAYELDSDTNEAIVIHNVFANAATGAIVIPESVTYKGVVYSVTSIGDYAFQSRKDVTSISIPNSVKEIGSEAFKSCINLTSVTIGNSVETIGQYAFYGCTSLTSITLPNSLEKIRNNAFLQCTGLTSITLPNSLEEIGESAFQGCVALTSVTMGDGLTSIGMKAFYDCSRLQSITIPHRVTNIGISSFQKCTGLKSLTIENGVTSIAYFAFADCSALRSITIPNSVMSLGDYAFSNCFGLNSVTSLKDIPIKLYETVFNDNDGNFTSATLYVPKGTKAKYEATSAWNKFQKIEELPVVNGVLIDGIYYNLYSETSEAEVTNRLGGDVKGKGSYSGVVVIPPTVNYGGVKYNVTSIGNRAFFGSSDLTSVTIPNSVTDMGYYAFESCTGLASITIPNSVKSLKEGVFQGCSGLTSVTIPNSVTSIGHSAFSGCSSLPSIKIPNSVKSLEPYAFNGCSRLYSITIPNSVTSIAARVFWECSGLTYVTIPASVTSIGEGVFHNCSSLTSVTSWITNPFEINENVFWIKGVFNTSATLYVPKGTKAKYEATPAWNLFKKIEEKVQKGDVNEDGAVDVADIATIIDLMAKSIYDPAVDVNGDIGIDVADIAEVIDIMSGKVVEPEPKPEEIIVYKACPDGNHPHWIDLGLPSGTVWACCNEGASSPEEYGGYYTFDEAQAYNPPSMDQIEELLNNTTSEWITQNGGVGRKFTGSNGGAVFLPAAGHVQSGEFYNGGILGYYWSSKPNGSAYAYGLSFGSGGTSIFSWDSRNLGRSVRPVRKN
ncbi:MAG: leucine-rich repeat protein [Prevotella sp.]|nr:leucine-rich repeat protein [Prevotella sp.]